MWPLLIGRTLLHCATYDPEEQLRVSVPTGNPARVGPQAALQLIFKTLADKMQELETSL
jgi:hypothetical protein